MKGFQFDLPSVDMMLFTIMIADISKPYTTIIFGATSGIGLSCAKNLLSQDCSVVSVSSRNIFPFKSSNVTHISLDLFSPLHHQLEVFSAYKDILLAADSFIYSVSSACPLQSILDVNPADLFHEAYISTVTLHNFLRWYIETLLSFPADHILSKHRSFVVISSFSASSSSPHSSPSYSLGKASQLSLSRYYSDLVIKHNLGRFNLVCPSLTSTPLSSKVLGAPVLESMSPLDVADITPTILSLTTPGILVPTGCNIPVSYRTSF